MTDEERAEEFVKNEVCIKLCPTYESHNGKCGLFPKCHYVSTRIKFYGLGLAEGRKELKEELSKIANIMRHEMNEFGWGGWKEDLYNSIIKKIKEMEK